ncbi:hypothetical protein FQR65_LT01850 [Abscondita terminalis]|nr:hypothetical protein FQR65_LT01850 [Abscondita terminalis]
MDCSAQTGNPFVDTVKSGIPLLCAKIEGIDGNGKPFEERNCTANLGPSSCSLLVNSISIMEKAKSVQCHTCDSDYCNSGTTLFATFGYSLKCYNCHVEKGDGCIKSAKPVEQPCGNPTPNHSQFCYYKVAYDNVRKIHFTNSSCIEVPAGSQLDKSSVPDCKTPPANVEIKECRVCASDLCNSAPVFSSSFVTMMCLPVAFMFAKIFMH